MSERDEAEDLDVEEMAGVLRAGFRSIVLEADEWRPLARHVQELIRRALRSRDEEIERLGKQSALKSRIIDRLPLCPDHRDKVRDLCCWCEVERLRQREAMWQEYETITSAQNNGVVFLSDAERLYELRRALGLEEKP